MTLFAALATPVQLAAQHVRYKLVVIDTLGGPQSYGDAGHGAANINNRGIAAGTADTNTPDPNYPNFNPLITSIGPYPFVYHAFLTKNGSPTDLEALPGANDSSPTFITENGLVSGISLNGSIDPLTGWPEERAVLWQDGKIIDLGTLGGYESQAGFSGVNSRGQVTGFSGNAIPDQASFFGLGTQTRAFLWDKRNGMQDIGTLGGPDAAAAFINERGQIVGISTTGLLTVDPFLWEPPTRRYPNGRMVDLGSLGGTFGFFGDGFALNNRGQVVGLSNLAGDLTAHPFLWTAPGPMRDLGTLGGPTGIANAINDAGEVVGFADRSPDAPTVTDAFLWKNGSMTDLGTLAGDCFSGAFGINAHTQVVGQSITCDFTGFRAFLWENGSMIDLNVFVPPGSDLTLTEVEKINDRGEMFGIGTRANGEDRAFFLIPCQEGEEGCIDASETAAIARQDEPLITKSVAQPHKPATQIGPWRARFARRYHIPGLWTP
jgi:probable HAF family extracellular repeat protein